MENKVSQSQQVHELIQEERVFINKVRRMISKLSPEVLESADIHGVVDAIEYMADDMRRFKAPMDVDAIEEIINKF
mgnify:CR=1 FL=1